MISEANYIAWQISSTIRAAWQSHSPSKLFTDIGASVPQGLKLGIESGAEDVIEAADNMADMVVGTSLNYSYDTVYGNAHSSTDAYLNQIITLLDKLQNLQVVMDSGEVGGVLAPEMSNEFERISKMQNRG